MQAVSEEKPDFAVINGIHAQPSNQPSISDAILSNDPDHLEHVAEAGDARPAASASDMQGSLSACDHQRGSDSGVTSPDGIADGEVNSACLHKEVSKLCSLCAGCMPPFLLDLIVDNVYEICHCLQAPSKRLKSSLHQAESERWLSEPAEEQHLDSVTQTLPAVEESVIDVANRQLCASGSRTSAGLKREVSVTEKLAQFNLYGLQLVYVHG